MCSADAAGREPRIACIAKPEVSTASVMARAAARGSSFKCRAEDRARRADFEGRSRDYLAVILPRHDPGHVPVQKGDELGKEVPEPGENHDVGGLLDHLEVADDGLRHGCGNGIVEAAHVDG